VSARMSRGCYEETGPVKLQRLVRIGRVLSVGLSVGHDRDIFWRKKTGESTEMTFVMVG